jgi:LuxR family transcriptional regulator, maltose regulon positive regulatory protein
MMGACGEPDRKWIAMVDVQATGPEGDLLLATKTTVPRLREGRVARPRLLEQLRAATGREFVLVCAPAGFGKSTLLAEWVKGDRRPVAWLSLDEGDNDPVRFWRHIAAAMDRARPGVAERASLLVGGPTSSSFMPAVTALVNDLAESTEDVVLVVDDYHLIHAQHVHRSLEFLLDHLPGSLRLVMASRSDPPLPLARLRARGQSAELRAADLRFTHGEAAQLIAASTGLDLPEDVVVALGERTEGWVAGLQLAALSLQGRRDVEGFVEEFSGSHRYVLDYLTEEVLDRLSPDIRTFLLETSVLDRLSGALCDAILERRDSQLLLESVERANLFLLPLDDERRWWRYHHLFADLLRSRLARDDPARAAALHHAAAGWYERHGLPDDAIGHALAGGDHEWAAQIVETHLERHLWRRNEGATLERWLTALSPEVVRGRPRLVLGQAIVAVLGGRVDDVESLLAVVERAIPQAHGLVYRPSVGRRSSIMTNLRACLALCRADLARARGDLQREAAFARAALAGTGESDDLLRAMARYHLAEVDWLTGKLTDSERKMSAILAEWANSDEWFVLLRVGLDLGALQRAQGRLGAALNTYRRLESKAGTTASALAGMAQVGAAIVFYERDDLTEAATQAAAGVERCRRLVYGPPLVTGLITLARIRLALGDPAGAHAAIAEAETAMPEIGDQRVPLGPRRAELMLATGNVAEAVNWVRDRGLTADDEPVYPRDEAYAVLARVMIATGDPGPVVPMLERWRAVAEAQGRVAYVLAGQVLQAVARAALGDEPAALAALARALALAAPEGYLRLFLNEGAVIADLLRTLLIGRRLEKLAAPDKVPRAFLTRLCAAFERQGTPVLPAAPLGAVAVPGLVEPLSRREREVLGLVAAGRPNQAIARELFIGVDTVKRHVSHLFVKLDVTNRTEAVARARALGLLE